MHHRHRDPQSHGAVAGPLPAPNNPQHGDVVIVKEDGDLATGYTIRHWHAKPQLYCPSRHEALGCASAFARQQAVDVWQGDGDAYTLLERYRPRKSERL